MMKLGAKYKQDSVIYTAAQKNEMVFTTGPDKGKAIRGEGWSRQDTADDFYTEVTHSDGKVSKFQLNFDFDAGAKPYCAAGVHTKGGPGSGCHGENCGRHAGSGHETTPYDRNIKAARARENSTARADESFEGRSVFGLHRLGDDAEKEWFGAE
jgi:hypothetical protein